jgi:hypothetical protein
MQPIPLRPDIHALRASERRSFNRACTAMAMSVGRNARPADEILKSLWPDDSSAARILKAASNPTSTTSFPGVQSVTVLPMLAPAAASMRVLSLGHQLDLAGINTIRIPYIGATGRPQLVFVAEASPAPVISLNMAAGTLGPTRKILVQAAVTAETQQASADTATTIVGQALSVAAEEAIDAALFGSAAATEEAPAGLLNGVAPIASAATQGVQGVADDLALLTESIANAGINPDGMVIVTTAPLAVKLKVLASPKFTNEVLSSASIPDGAVIALVPQALAVGYSDPISVQSSREVLIHMEDTSPLPIASPGTPPTVAAPSMSAFQQDLLVLKVRARCAWTIQPGAIAHVTGANW